MVNISLTLLPLFASSSPTAKRSSYEKTVVNWYLRAPLVAETIFSQFKMRNKMTSQLSVHGFVEKCKNIDLFSVDMVRAVARRTQVISDINPGINRDYALERDIFLTGRPSVTSDKLNTSVTNNIDMETV